MPALVQIADRAEREREGKWTVGASPSAGRGLRGERVDLIDGCRSIGVGPKKGRDLPGFRLLNVDLPSLQSRIGGFKLVAHFLPCEGFLRERALRQTTSKQKPYADMRYKAVH